MDPDQLMTVGALAERTGLTVRTLHHWDELGLVVPSHRSHAGHRGYAADDVERLYRVVALRQLGLSLTAIGRALDGNDLRDVVERQLAATRARLAEERRLAVLLEGVLHRLGRATRPGLETVLEAIRLIEKIEKHYTPEQLEWLAERREQFGEAAIHEVEREWAALFARLRTAREAGLDPEDPANAADAARAAELFAAFHGGDASIRSSAAALWEDSGPEEASGGTVDAELFGYLRAVQEAHGGG
jgi:DNA-binding transcriptional MerR regulator